MVSNNLARWNQFRNVGLALILLWGVLTFTVMAIPTGVTNLSEPKAATTNFSVPITNLDVNSLVQDGKLLYEMGRLTEAEEKFKTALALEPKNGVANYFIELVREAKFIKQMRDASQVSQSPGAIFSTWDADAGQSNGLPARLTMTFKIDHPPATEAGLKKLFRGADGQLPATRLIRNGDNEYLLAEGTPERMMLLFHRVLKLNGVSMTESKKIIQAFLGGQVATTDMDSASTKFFNLHVHIKASFIAVPPTVWSTYVKSMGVDYQTNQPDGVAEIMQPGNFDKALKKLQMLDGVTTLAEQETVTVSGQKTLMRATENITVITNFIFQTNGDSALGPQIAQFEIGPTLDVTPYVLSGSHAINLTVTPSLTEFLGYTNPSSTTMFEGTSNSWSLPIIRPQFGRRQIRANFIYRMDR